MIKNRCEENRQKYRDMVAVCKPITFGKKSGKQEMSKLSSNSSKIS